MKETEECNVKETQVVLAADITILLEVYFECNKTLNNANYLSHWLVLGERGSSLLKHNNLNNYIIYIIIPYKLNWNIEHTTTSVTGPYIRFT